MQKIKQIILPGVWW